MSSPTNRESSGGGKLALGSKANCYKSLVQVNQTNNTSDLTEQPEGARTRLVIANGMVHNTKENEQDPNYSRLLADLDNCCDTSTVL